MAFAIVVVGTSLGGLRALETLLSGLPEAFPLPVAIVQHRGACGGEALPERLQRQSALPVREPEDKEVMLPGQVYLAPADYHLLVERGSFALSTEGPVCYARPSIDVLFESAADTYADEVIAVILTGAGKDGAQGAVRVKERGGFLLVQEPATAESSVTPEAVLATAEVDRILPLPEMAPFLASLCRSARE
jgi:two-component system chemotaxis response regulator CheB